MTEDEAIFANTNNKTETTKWYSISGAPAMENFRYGKDRMLMPFSARFIFEEGDCKDLFLNGRLMLVDGSVGEKVEQIRDIAIWNQNAWPAWLHNLYQLACRDLQADQKVLV